MWRGRIRRVGEGVQKFCDEEAFTMLERIVDDLNAELLNPQITQIYFDFRFVFALVQPERLPAGPVRHATPPPSDGAQPAGGPDSLYTSPHS